jgi:CubicO group peptidase (beta-lactamase class C family)
VSLAVRDIIEAEPEQVGMSSARLGWLSDWAQRQIDSKATAGALTMVARHGKTVHFQTYGSMDEEAGKPMQPDTIFRIYSMSKPIVSAALMMLYEEGRFQLDDPAGKFIPELRDLKVWAGGTAERPQLREAARPMTVRDLLMHTGGMPGLYGIGPGPSPIPLTPVQQLWQKADIQTLRTDGKDLADMARRIATVPLQVDPGANWIYGLATDMVGYLVEVLSGEPLDRFLQKRMFEPLDMPDTAFSVPEEKLERFSACYRPGNRSEPKHVLQDSPASSPFARPTKFFSGVAGLTSTASDYMRFAKMLCNGGELDGARILSPRTVKLMATNHLPGGADLQAMVRPGGMPGAPGVGFGLSFGVLFDPAKNQTLGTPGEYYWGGAASTSFFVSPADDMVAMFWTQLLGGIEYQFGRFLRVLSYQALID